MSCWPHFRDGDKIAHCFNYTAVGKSKYGYDNMVYIRQQFKLPIYASVNKPPIKTTMSGMKCQCYEDLCNMPPDFLPVEGSTIAMNSTFDVQSTSALTDSVTSVQHTWQRSTPTVEVPATTSELLDTTDQSTTNKASDTINSTNMITCILMCAVGSNLAYLYE